MADRPGTTAAAPGRPAAAGGVGGDARGERPLAPARAMAAELWRGGQSRWAIQEALRSRWRLGRQQAEVVVAEQAAVERIVQAGLDPALVADEVDQLLRHLGDPTTSG